MTTIKKLTLSVLLGVSSLLAGTIAGGEVSLGYYSHTPSGTASYSPFGTINPEVDLEEDFGWSTKQDLFLKASIEHPVPMLPNIRLGYTDFSNAGTGTVTDFSWGDIRLFSGEIDTALDMQYFDIALYYELLDNWLSFDAGLTMRYIDGDIAVDTRANIGPVTTLPLSESTDFSLWLPMLYGKARFDVPNTDISMQLEGNFITYQDTTLYDFEISVRYTFGMGLGIEGGFKGLSLDSTDLTDGLTVDADTGGPFAAVVWDF
ncbi:MAG TPA: TIGR04219 family outer membrane beta-barrel protein [Desulfobacterales bacterium]|nr:TIGR04219 family outer membrane beta-barrel protein [Desulfobacterales bacterium]